tara:strand:- start:243 stop:932 length:690 start_codon:yes stop_codon:yes gene_type:complete
MVSGNENKFTLRARAIVKMAREEGFEYKEPSSKAINLKGDIANAIRAQGVPERIVSVFIEPDGPKLTTATKAVVKFLTAPRDAWCLVLAGNPGTGKSTAAAHYLWVTADTSNMGSSTAQRWWTAHEVSRVSNYASSPGYKTELEKLMRIPVLVIDDLGVEYLDKNGFFNSRFDEIMDARYNNFRKTIITTNLAPDSFEKRYGKRVTTRIRHGFKAGGNYIQVDEESMRS